MLAETQQLTRPLHPSIEAITRAFAYGTEKDVDASGWGQSLLGVPALSMAPHTS